jgi:Zn ribbon nucleic-acid-binding protein
MSDSFQSYVFAEPVVSDAHAEFGRVATWLMANQIIGLERAHNTLEGEGYVPGARASTVLKADDDGWRELDVNGVVLESGRIIETSAEWKYSRCPNCQVSIETDPEADDCQSIYDALDAYHEGRGDLVECPKCGGRNRLSDWDFGHGMAVGSAKITFWNWPEQIDDLPRQLAQVSGITCRKVWGRI